MSHFLLCYAAWCREGNAPENFRYSGDEVWHVSLCSFFNKDKASKSTEKMFGSGQAGHSCFWFWVIRKNPEGKHGKPRVFRPKVKDLPPDALTFSMDDKPLETVEALETLAMNLELQWPDEAEPPPEQFKAEPASKGKAPQTNSTSPPPSAAHPVTSASAEPITSPQTKKRTPSPRRKKHRKRVRRRKVKSSPAEMPPRGDQPLADWIRNSPLEVILDYLCRLEKWPQPTRAEAIREVLNWESRRALAEKLPDVPHFLDVVSFFDDEDVPLPVEIRDAVSAFIAADPDLGRALRKSLKNYEWYCDAVWIWFTQCAKWFPVEFNAAFTSDWKDPEYRTILVESLKDRGVKTITSIIEDLFRSGFWYVGTCIIKMYLKTNYALLRRELKTQEGRKDVLHFCRRLEKFQVYFANDLGEPVRWAEELQIS